MRQRDAHEYYGVFARQLHWIAAIIVGSLIVISWLMYVLFKTWLGPPPRTPVASLPPRPRVQSNPPVELAAQQARERKLLQHYQWIDRGAGIARIPIDRAMELIVQQDSAKPTGGATR